MFKGILSLRCATRYYFYHILFEWEDALKESLNIPIKKINPVHKLVLQRMNKTGTIINNLHTDYYIAFLMNVESIKIYSGYNVIPIFCDVFSYTAEKLYYATRSCEIFYVTSYGMYEYLIEKFNCANVRYIPLTCPDSYIKNFELNYQDYPIQKRIIDVLQYGRRNEKLHSWMLTYVERHPETEYVYRHGNYKKTVYVSTKCKTMKKASSRKNFNELIHSSKIVFVSARGKDEKEGELKLDFVTPRIFEAIAAGCHVIGRYSDNKEKEIYGLEPICKIPDSYEEFEEYIGKLLRKETVNKDMYIEFLNKNKTSVRFINLFKN